jgi:hypothetical protein
MIMIDDGDYDNDERKLCKIENYQDLSFTNFSSQIFFILNFLSIFQNLVAERGGVRVVAGWCKNMEAQRKKL